MDSVYFQVFERTGRPISAPRVVARSRRGAGVIGAGPARRRRATAAGAFALRGAARPAVDMRSPSEATPYPDIVAIARIGLAAKPEDWPARPLYVKPPDAKPASGAAAIARIEG